MSNLKIYDNLKEVPEEYLKPITGGRLKGMSDIKPQWRIMRLTEQFGPCGIGWKIQNVSFTYQTKGEEIVCNCSLEFLFKHENEWSEPILGFGGSMFSTVEKNGTYVSDEAQKMAYTDAISVATKMIGMASDVYMGHGGKYDGSSNDSQKSEDVIPVGIAPTLKKVIDKTTDLESLNTIWNNNTPLHDNLDFVKLVALKRADLTNTVEGLAKIFNSVQKLHADGDFVSQFTAKKKLLVDAKNQKQTA